MLYTLAFPRWHAAAEAQVEGWRRAWLPALCDVVPAHFTLVFGSAEADAEAYGAHVAAVAAQQPAVDFCCRCAMLDADHRSGEGLVTLVPDEGYAALTRLHAVLHRGPFAPLRRLDLPFVPHVTVGSAADRALALGWADALNARPLQLAGRIEALAVAQWQDGVLAVLARWPLCGTGG